MQSTYDKIQFYHLRKKQKNELVKKLKESLAKEKRIQLVIIFGSIIRRNNIRDIDICIHSAPTLNFQELLDLNAQIELNLGVPVDLVELTSLPPRLRINILKNGTLIKGQKTLIQKLLNQAHTEHILAAPS